MAVGIIETAGDKLTRIATVPRHLLDNFDGFVPATIGYEMFPTLFENIKWIDRDEAEESDDLCQPIPCAILQDKSGRYIVNERVDDARHDMKGRIALTYGGHIDYEDASMAPNFEVLSLFALHRELKEEMEIRSPKSIDPLGLLVCTDSPEARRHVAVLYSVVVTEPVTTRASEEFKTDSEHNGISKSVEELKSLRDSMDPWSRLVFDKHILPNGATEADGTEITPEEAMLPKRFANFIVEKNPFAFKSNPQGIIELTLANDGHMRNVYVVLGAYQQRATRDRSISTDDYLDACDWTGTFEDRFGVAQKVAFGS